MCGFGASQLRIAGLLPEWLCPALQGALLGPAGGQESAAGARTSCQVKGQLCGVWIWAQEVEVGQP